MNAITDVAGVRVGHSTIVRGRGRLVPGTGPIRTGVTAVIPRDDVWHRKVAAGAAVLNGAGELTGLHWVIESGFLEVPVLYTNTHSVGSVMDGVVAWMVRENRSVGIQENVVAPVVGECDDSSLNDIRGLHVTRAHVAAALDSARNGPVEEGSVGAGTGMMSFGFKAGIGTASRVVPVLGRSYTLGALVVANFGQTPELLIDGRALGPVLMNLVKQPAAPRLRDGSVQVLFATDAPVDARQLGRIARRAGLGLGRVGHRGHDGSGDFALAFSTAHTIRAESRGSRVSMTVLPEPHLDSLFEAAEDCVEESVLNALFAAPTMEGRDGEVAPGIPAAEVARRLRLPGAR
ncbi:MAG: P1 family peptidase [Candidatus Riflebacteria bacterium]|nr:P1 family peptidase [Candidatus Riflebacteria bacterium]